MYTSPFANIYNAVLERLAAKAPLLRYIDQDLGQLENYEMRPPVAWPCALIDIEDVIFSDFGDNLGQNAEGFVQIRVGQQQYSPANKLAPKAIRDMALKYYDTEQEVFEALHGFTAPGFSKLLRRAVKNEQRNDDLRVRVIRFAFSFEDTTGSKKYTKLATPLPNINPDSLQV